MSPEVFPQFLKDPSSLHRISYQELKTLVMQYPYCFNLRYLLHQKSRLDNNVDEERNLGMVATYALDRTQLHSLISRTENEEIQEEIEVLELENEIPERLELPVLDFSDGVESSGITDDEPPVELDLDLGQPEFEAEETVIEEEEEIEALDDFEDLFSIDEEEKEKIEEEDSLKIEKINTRNLELSISAENISIIENEEIEEKIEVEISDDIVLEKVIEIETIEENTEIPVDSAKEEFVEDSIEIKEEEPLIEEKTQVEKEIDSSIQAAIDKLTTQQNEEYEEDDLEEEEKEVILEAEIPEIIPTQEEVPPTVSNSFSSWLTQFGKPSFEKEDVVKLKEKSEAEPVREETTIQVEGKRINKIISNYKREEKDSDTKQRKVRVIQFAEKSLKENEEIISATLAKILVIQTKYKKAIRMYEQLSLKFPEKSGYFAAEIKKIEKLR